jgi:hypothetical protein
MDDRRYSIATFLCGKTVQDIAMFKTKRKLAILCALDNVKLKGKAGAEIFLEFNESGIYQHLKCTKREMAL